MFFIYNKDMENKIAEAAQKKVRRGKGLPKNKYGLTEPQVLFVDKYMETNNATEAAIYAGYSPRTAGSKGHSVLKQVEVVNEINRRMVEINKKREEIHKQSIATSEQVMEFLTKVMNGEIKDQFGLDAPLAERTKAAVELAKRTVDLDNRINGKPDNVLQVKLDWSRPNKN